MNYQSICPQRYKTGVFKTFLSRANEISSDWETFERECRRISQLLTNNNYPMNLIRSTMNDFNASKYIPQQEPTQTEDEHVNLFYRNQMHSRYKQEEQSSKNILNYHVTSEPGISLKLRIDYKNRTVSNLFLKNDPHCKSPEQISHVVHRYTCNAEECHSSKTYIDQTTTTLKQRMTTHAQNGSIKSHNLEEHQRRLRAADILACIDVLHTAHDRQELVLAERS